LNWLQNLKGVTADKMAQSGPSSVAKPDARLQPPAEIFWTTVQIRGPSGNDPGEVATVWFTFESGKVTLTSETGVPIGSPITCQPHLDPRSVARAGAWARLQNNGRFDRRIEYGPSGVV
jgi:hypothetical protein